MLKGNVIGNLGRDAELKMIAGTQYAVFSVAHSEKRTDVNGQPQELTTWVRCLKRDVNAKLAPYLVKGKKVYCDGRLSLSSYVTQQGETKYDLSIWVDSLEFMDSLPSQNQATPAQQLNDAWQQAKQQASPQEQSWLSQKWQDFNNGKKDAYQPPANPITGADDKLPF